jgi:putative peptidoglycan lipid II flippase
MKNNLLKKINPFLKSSLIVSIFFAIDKIFAFVRQTFVARQFGLSYELDVFNAANNIPDLLSALISGGALGVALIPVLTEYFEKNQEKEKQEGWRIFSIVVNLAFIITGIIAVIIAIFAKFIITKLIAPGFPPEQQMLSIELMRLDLIAIMIFSISGLVMAGLQSNKHFLFPALAPILYNVGQIFGVMILSPYGVIIGATLHLLIQLPPLFKMGYRWYPGLGLKDPKIHQLGTLLGPRVITKFFIFMFFIVRDNLASGMGEGAVTALNMGWFIMQVPETLLGTAFAIILLPTISEITAKKDDEKFKIRMNQAYRIMLALTIPAAAILAAGVQPAVANLLGYTAAETARVVLATRIYLLGLASHALLEITVRAFYAQKNAMVPLYAAATNAILYVIFAINFAKWWGFAGIAFANSLAFTLELILLLVILNRKHKGIVNFWRSLIRITLPSLAFSLIIWLIIENNWVASQSGLMQVFLSAILMLAGLLAVWPFIRPDLKLLQEMDA